MLQARWAAGRAFDMSALAEGSGPVVVPCAGSGLQVGCVNCSITVNHNKLSFSSCIISYMYSDYHSKPLTSSAQRCRTELFSEGGIQKKEDGRLPAGDVVAIVTQSHCI